MPARKLYAIALALLRGMTPQKYKSCIDEAGSAHAFCSAPSGHGAGTPFACQLREALPLLLEQAGELLERHARAGVQVLTYEEESYPGLLKNLPAPPPLLYGQGSLPLKASLQLCLVGTRKPSAYGLRMVEELVAGLAPYQPLLLSGLAYGIDAAVHEAAIAHGLATIAVVAGGLDQLYPAAHHALAERCMEHGGVVTEQPLGTRAKVSFFPARNRIMAGMAEATIVIEAAGRSGALITARYANDFHREVFAVPGLVTSPVSAGCHLLIKSHQAHLLEQAEEVIAMIRPGGLLQEQAYVPPTTPPPPLIFGSAAEEQVFRLLQTHWPESLSLEAIAAATALPASQLSHLLLSLELRGYVRCQAGTLYQAVQERS